VQETTQESNDSLFKASQPKGDHTAPAVSVDTVEHLGVVAGLIAESSLRELLNERPGITPENK